MSATTLIPCGYWIVAVPDWATFLLTFPDGVLPLHGACSEWVFSADGTQAACAAALRGTCPGDRLKSMLVFADPTIAPDSTCDCFQVVADDAGGLAALSGSMPDVPWSTLPLFSGRPPRN